MRIICATGKEFTDPCSVVDAESWALSEPEVSTCPLLMQSSQHRTRKTDTQAQRPKRIHPDDGFRCGEGWKGLGGRESNTLIIYFLEEKVGRFLRTSLEVEDYHGNKWGNRGREQASLSW